MICGECDEVVPVGQRECPSCTSRQFLLIGKLLGLSRDERRQIAALCSAFGTALAALQAGGDGRESIQPDPSLEVTREYERNEAPRA